MSATAKSVLVTGASTGIGRATVERLASDGVQVFAGLRDLASAPADWAGRVIPLRLDVTDAAQIAAAAEDLSARTGGRLDGVVHNAGIAVAGALEEVEGEELREIFEVNVFAPVLLTQALLPSLRAARGRVVIVGSVGGRVAVPFGGPYHATKFALEALADSLRLELRPQGVGVAIVEPGTIRTPIWAKAERRVEAQRSRLSEIGRALYDARLATFQERLRSADRDGDEPRLVAAKIAKALDGRGSRYPLGRGVGAITRLRPLIPDALFDRVVGSRVA
jgi:NAD(P)-dependent dehydrogenase (short-subunit alcohol dehydrogenase family)